MSHCPFSLPGYFPSSLYFSLSCAPFLFLSPLALQFSPFPLSSIISPPVLSVAAYLFPSGSLSLLPCLALSLSLSIFLPLSLSPSVPLSLHLSRQVGSMGFWAGRSAQDILQSSASVCWPTTTGSGGAPRRASPGTARKCRPPLPVYPAPHARATASAVRHDKGTVRHVADPFGVLVSRSCLSLLEWGETIGAADVILTP